MGINRDVHMNFDPRGGAFDLAPHNLCHEVRMAAKKVLEKVTFIRERKNTEILRSF